MQWLEVRYALERKMMRKVAIVSPRPQTTRDETIGVCTKGNTQLIFLDTPGIVPQKDIKMFVSCYIDSLVYNTIS